MLNVKNIIQRIDVLEENHKRMFDILWIINRKLLMLRDGKPFTSNDYDEIERLQKQIEKLTYTIYGTTRTKK